MRLLLRPWDDRVESKMDFLLPYRKCYLYYIMHVSVNKDLTAVYPSHLNVCNFTKTEVTPINQYPN